MFKIEKLIAINGDC